MKLALISFAKEDPETLVPIGFLPLFDGTVAEAQVRIANELGAAKFIFLSPAMHGKLLQYTDALMDRGIDAEIVRSASDLAKFASDEDDLIFLGDGILPGADVQDILMDAPDELILVTDNADEHAAYERIDLNHRWLGIASLKAQRLAALAEIPDDWDVGSALLRTAVQAECRREMLSGTQVENRAVSSLGNSASASQFVQAKLADYRPSGGNFLERLAVWPLTRKLLPRIWKTPDIGRYLGGISPVLSFLAPVLAYFAYPALSLGFLAVAALFLGISGKISVFSNPKKGMQLGGAFFSIFALITLAILVFSQSVPANIAPHMVILALLSGSFLVSRRLVFNSWVDWFRPDNLLIILILFIFTAAGNFVGGLLTSALLCMAYLVTGHLPTPRRDKKTEIPSE